MLNIPSQIIALCKADSTRKNFRVHFPNGENADLTNADIVAGTVQFTESVSSKDVLQFGLAESPRIQFECVNVINIYGMEIECGIEIDTSSLTPAEITSIQGNPGDGVLVLENDSDIGYGFYRIPYGTFTVTSCPRSAGAMWKRRVEAYGDLEESTLLYRKLTSTFSTDTIQQNIPNLVAQEINYLPFTTTDSSVTMVSVSISSGSMTALSWTYGGDSYTISATNTSRTYYAYDTINDSVGDLFRFTCEADTSVIDEMYEDIRELGYFQDPNNSEWVFQAFRCMFEPLLVFGANNDTLAYKAGSPFDNVEDSGYLYPYTDNSHHLTIAYPSYTLDFNLEKNSVVQKTYHFVPYITNPSLKKYNATDTRLQYMNVTVQNTRDNGNGYYGYFNAIDASNMVEGFAELNAKFIQNDRLGGRKVIGLSQSSPISMDTDEYMELWWDEYDISPIGSINIAYKDSDANAEQIIEYATGYTGDSVYDMTSNYILKNLTVTASVLGESVYSYVTNLIDTYFIPNISDIAFTPVQLSLLGLPYLEPGDYLEIDDGDNGTVGTYILTRTISGEQFLTDDIESKGGEIIGNVRNA